MQWDLDSGGGAALEWPVVIQAHTTEPNVTNRMRIEPERRIHKEMNDRSGFTG